MSHKSRYVWAFVLAGTSGCGGGGGDGPGIVNAPVVVSVTVGQPSTNPIDIGGTVQLTVDVQVQNGASQAVEWSSNAPNVASVNSSGVVTGVSAGQATITATSTANRNKTGTVGITVNPPRVVAVTLNSGARTISVGQNFAVLATVDTRGTIAKTVAFSTNNAAIATVTSSDGLNATITGVGAGQATITATSTVDATKSTTLAVTVTGTVRITNVNPSVVNIRPGATLKIVPTVQADAGVSTAVNYQSQNTAIATVASDGTVTGVAVGSTTVVIQSVAVPSVSVTVPVNVRTGVSSVNLTPDRDSVRRGNTKQLSVAVVADPGVATTVNVSSANTAIATVDAQLRVTAVANGQTFIRALSTADPTVGDSTLIVVVDPCSFFVALAFGVANNGNVNDLSCTALSELYSFSLNQQTTIAMTGLAQFPANFTVLGDKTGSWFTALNTGVTGTSYVVATANRFYVRMAAQNLTTRGSFTITPTANAAIPQGVCVVVATTGVTVNVPLSACSFQPQGRPAGAYNSMQFAMLPVMNPGDRVTVTVTAPAGVVPLVEVVFGSNAPVQAIGTTNTVSQAFTAPATAGYTRVTVSTRDAAQSGTVTVKLEGPPAISFDSFVFGSGAVGPVRAPLSPAPLYP
jgi:uncharacterized protein YjdB